VLVGLLCQKCYTCKSIGEVKLRFTAFGNLLIIKAVRHYPGPLLSYPSDGNIPGHSFNLVSFQSPASRGFQYPNVPNVETL